MKIALVTTFFHPVSGGVESHVHDLAEELMKKGHEVEVLCSDSTKNGQRLMEKTSVYSGINIHRFRTWFNLSYYHKFYPGLFIYLLKNKFDIVHVHGFRKAETYMALITTKFTKGKVVLTSHNPFPTNSRSRLQEYYIWLHDKIWGRLFTKRLYRIITLTKAEKDIFISKFKVDPEKIVRIPNALSEKFYLNGNADEFYKEWNITPEKWKGIVVSAGRITQDKGFQNLYTAVKKLPNVLFFIAGGDDGYLSQLKALYAECPNMILSGHFMSVIEKLTAMYQAADLFVFPSFHEAFGLVLLEAMAQGKPVVSTNVGGPTDFVKESFGVLLDPSDQNKWYETIKSLLEDKPKLVQMGSAAKEESKQFSWDKIINKIIKAYS